MKKAFTKLLSVFLCILMVVYLLPTSVYAATINKISELFDKNETENVFSGENIYAIGEDTSLRTENSKTIRMSDGSYYVATYETAVHYLDENGKWEEIDNTLVDDVKKSDDDISGSSTSKGKWNVKFANNSSSSKLMEIKEENYKVSFHLVGANKSKAASITNPSLSEEGLSTLEQITMVKKGVSSVKYAEILDGVDLEYVMIGNTVKENIIVKEISEDYRYVFDMKLNKLTAELNDDGAIVLKDDKNGNIVYVITLPYMFDANGECSGSVSYSLEKIKNKEYRITVTADSDWMNDDSRAFPVTIDPPISAGGFDTVNVDDTHVKSGSPNQAFNTEGYLYAGYDSNATAGNNRIFWRLNTLPDIPNNCVIVDAKLSLGQRLDNGYSAIASATFLTLAIRKVTSTWNPYTTTWNNQPTIDSEIYDYQNTNATLNGQYLTWDITMIAKSWYSGEANYGVCIYPDVEYDGLGNGKWANARFVSCNMPSGQMLAPIFTVRYRNTVGLEDYYTYQTQNIGRAGTGYISDYTSQLTLVRTDIMKNSSAMSFNINHVYNDGYAATQYIGDGSSSSNYGRMKLGYGWKLNIQETVSLVTFEIPETTSSSSTYVTYLVYNDGDGTDHYFWYDLDKDTFFDEDGLGLEVTLSGNEYTMKDSQDNVKIFVNGLLYTVSDANGNTVKIVFDTYNGRPTSGTNRIVSVEKYNNGYQTSNSAETIATLSYDSSNNLIAIYDASGRETDFGYAGNLLSYIQLPDLQMVQYDYQYKTINGVQTAFLYTAYDMESKYGIQYTHGDVGEPYMVTHVKEYYKNGTTTQYGQEFSINNVIGEKTEYRYSGPDNINGNTDDIITTYLFDFNGRCVNVYTTDTTYKVVYGADTVTYTPSSSNGTSDFKQRNRIESIGSTGISPKNYMIDGSVEYTGTTLYTSSNMGSFWTSYGTSSNATASITNEKARTGYYSIKLSSTSVNSTELRYTHNTRSFYLYTGKTYTFSAYVDVSSLIGSTTGGVYLKATSSTNTFIGDKIRTDLTSDLIGNKWQRISVTFTPTANGLFDLSCCMIGSTGTVYFDDFQLEEAEAPSSFNMVGNGAMKSTYSWYTGTDAHSQFAVTNINGYEYNSVRIVGMLTSPSYAFQEINVGKSSNTTFILSGWAYAHSVTLEDTHQFNTEPSRFSMSACIEYADGELEDHFINFNSDIKYKWQYGSGVIVPKRANQTINKITLYLNYGYNANSAFFRDIALVEEEVQTYTYDDNGNLIAANQTDNSTISLQYSNNNLISQQQNNKLYTYTYKTTGNTHLLDTVSNDGITMSFTYDSAGNATGTVVQGINYSKNLITSTEYTDNGNLVSSSTDTNGITTNYIYNNRGLLTGDTNAKGITSRYDYNTENDRQNIAYISGLISVNYNYLNGALSTVVRGGYIDGLTEKQNQTYTFNRDNFGNVISISVGNYTLVAYIYEANNGNLLRTAYGDGTYIDNVYDELDRIVEIKINGITKYKYTYNGSGDLYSVDDIDNNTKYCYNYDSLNRLISSYQMIGTTISLLTQYDYDNESRVSVYHCGLAGAIGGTLGHTYSYTYDADDGNLKNISVMGDNIYGDTLGYTYDGLKRLSSKSITGQYRTLGQVYGYKNLSGTRTTMQIESLSWTLQGSTALSYSYAYDAVGNITSVSKDGVLVASYTYDDQNQLKTETLYDQDLFYTYNYDSYGNIRSVYKRQNSTNTLLDYEYYNYNDATWLDRLTSYKGTAITYDSIGNPLSYNNGSAYTFSWQNGRELNSVTHNGVSTSYAYNTEGIRVKKTYGSTTYNYYYADGALIRQTWGSNYIDFLYDENGSAYSIVYNGTQYYFVRNLQGDVTQIRSVYGTVVVEYAYDSWGQVLSISGSLANTLGQNNPIRYRGYYYDFESGFYYVSSRYYDPEIGRWINADDPEILLEDQDNLLQYNLFAYCFNNPVNMYDPDGYAAANIIGGIVGGVTGAALGVLLAKQLGVTGWKKWALISAATVGGAALGAFLGPYVAKLAKSIGTTVKTAVKTFARGELCFVAGTQILTENGKVPIENIKIGDYVYSEDPETGEKGLKRVAQTFINEINELVYVTVNGEEIVTTPGHPFYVVSKGWVGADELKVGDSLIVYKGKQVVVEKVKLELLSTPVTVYNFEVEDFHTYYVGENSVLVHNKGCGLNKLADSYIKKTLKLDAHAIKREYLGNKAKISLYDLAVDKKTGIIYIVDKAGKIITDTIYRSK